MPDSLSASSPNPPRLRLVRNGQNLLSWRYDKGRIMIDDNTSKDDQGISDLLQKLDVGSSSSSSGSQSGGRKSTEKQTRNTNRTDPLARPTSDPRKNKPSSSTPHPAVPKRSTSPFSDFLRHTAQPFKSTRTFLNSIVRGTRRSSSPPEHSESELEEGEIPEAWRPARPPTPAPPTGLLFSSPTDSRLGDGDDLEPYEEVSPELEHAPLATDAPQLATVSLPPVTAAAVQADLDDDLATETYEWSSEPELSRKLAEFLNAPDEPGARDDVGEVPTQPNSPIPRPEFAFSTGSPFDGAGGDTEPNSPVLRSQTRSPPSAERETIDPRLLVQQAIDLISEAIDEAKSAESREEAQIHMPAPRRVAPHPSITLPPFIQNVPVPNSIDELDVSSLTIGEPAPNSVDALDLSSLNISEPGQTPVDELNIRSLTIRGPTPPSEQKVVSALATPPSHSSHHTPTSLGTVRDARPKAAHASSTAISSPPLASIDPLPQQQETKSNSWGTHSLWHNAPLHEKQLQPESAALAFRGVGGDWMYKHEIPLSGAPSSCTPTPISIPPMSPAYPPHHRLPFPPPPPTTVFSLLDIDVEMPEHDTVDMQVDRVALPAPIQPLLRRHILWRQRAIFQSRRLLNVRRPALTMRLSRASYAPATLPPVPSSTKRTKTRRRATHGRNYRAVHWNAIRLAKCRAQRRFQRRLRRLVALHKCRRSALVAAQTAGANMMLTNDSDAYAYDIDGDLEMSGGAPQACPPFAPAAHGLSVQSPGSIPLPEEDIEIPDAPRDFPILPQWSVPHTPPAEQLVVWQPAKPANLVRETAQRAEATALPPQPAPSSTPATSLAATSLAATSSAPSSADAARSAPTPVIPAVTLPVAPAATLPVAPVAALPTLPTPSPQVVLAPEATSDRAATSTPSPPPVLATSTPVPPPVLATSISVLDYLPPPPDRAEADGGAPDSDEDDPSQWEVVVAPLPKPTPTAPTLAQPEPVQQEPVQQKPVQQEPVQQEPVQRELTTPVATEKSTAPSPSPLAQPGGAGESKTQAETPQAARPSITKKGGIPPTERRRMALAAAAERKKIIEAAKASISNEKAPPSGLAQVEQSERTSSQKPSPTSTRPQLESGPIEPVEQDQAAPTPSVRVDKGKGRAVDPLPNVTTGPSHATMDALAIDPQVADELAMSLLTDEERALNQNPAVWALFKPSQNKKPRTSEVDYTKPGSSRQHSVDALRDIPAVEVGAIVQRGTISSVRDNGHGSPADDVVFTDACSPRGAQIDAAANGATSEIPLERNDECMGSPAAEKAQLSTPPSGATVDTVVMPTIEITPPSPEALAIAHSPARSAEEEVAAPPSPAPIPVPPPVSQGEEEDDDEDFPEPIWRLKNDGRPVRALPKRVARQEAPTRPMRAMPKRSAQQKVPAPIISTWSSLSGALGDMTESGVAPPLEPAAAASSSSSVPPSRREPLPSIDITPSPQMPDVPEEEEPGSPCVSLYSEDLDPSDVRYRPGYFAAIAAEYCNSAGDIQANEGVHSALDVLAQTAEAFYEAATSPKPSAEEMDAGREDDAVTALLSLSAAPGRSQAVVLAPTSDQAASPVPTTVNQLNTAIESAEASRTSDVVYSEVTAPLPSTPGSDNMCPEPSVPDECVISTQPGDTDMFFLEAAMEAITEPDFALSPANVDLEALLAAELEDVKLHAWDRPVQDLVDSEMIAVPAEQAVAERPHEPMVGVAAPEAEVLEPAHAILCDDEDTAMSPSQQAAESEPIQEDRDSGLPYPGDAPEDIQRPVSPSPLNTSAIASCGHTSPGTALACESPDHAAEAQEVEQMLVGPEDSPPSSSTQAPTSPHVSVAASTGEQPESPRIVELDDVRVAPVQAPSPASPASETSETSQDVGHDAAKTPPLDDVPVETIGAQEVEKVQDKAEDCQSSSALPVAVSEPSSEAAPIRPPSPPEVEPSSSTPESAHESPAQPESPPASAQPEAEPCDREDVRPASSPSPSPPSSPRRASHSRAFVGEVLRFVVGGSYPSRGLRSVPYVKLSRAESKARKRSAQQARQAMLEDLAGRAGAVRTRFTPGTHRDMLRDLPEAIVAELISSASCTDSEPEEVESRPPTLTRVRRREQATQTDATREELRTPPAQPTRPPSSGRDRHGPPASSLHDAECQTEPVPVNTATREVPVPEREPQPRPDRTYRPLPTRRTERAVPEAQPKAADAKKGGAGATASTSDTRAERPRVPAEKPPKSRHTKGSKPRAPKPDEASAPAQDSAPRDRRKRPTRASDGKAPRSKRDPTTSPPDESAPPPQPAEPEPSAEVDPRAGDSQGISAMYTLILPSAVYLVSRWLFR